MARVGDGCRVMPEIEIKTQMIYTAKCPCGWWSTEWSEAKVVRDGNDHSQKCHGEAATGEAR